MSIEKNNLQDDISLSSRIKNESIIKNNNNGDIQMNADFALNNLQNMSIFPYGKLCIKLATNFF